MNMVCGNYIAGEWVIGSETTPDVNPSNTGDIVGDFPRASAADTDRAIMAASAAFPAWSRTTPQQRHDVLKRISDEILVRKDEIGHLISREAHSSARPSASSAIYMFGSTLSASGSLERSSVDPGWTFSSCHMPDAAMSAIDAVDGSFAST
jgi:acyl-CoA reductase-like NAD-dependent aldehyde dehydrogenase